MVALTARQFTYAEETSIPIEYEAVWLRIQYGCHVEDVSLSVAGIRAHCHPALSLDPAYFIVLVVRENYGPSQI